jgi:oligopeptide/dipeptide ABC transporter ATP-binding protein
VSALLEVRGLTLELATARGPVPVVAGLDLTLSAGRTLALVGESGSGKTLTALALMGLLPEAVRVVGGSIRWRGRELLTLGAVERRALCGRELAMVFQEPTSALNPVLPVLEQVAEVLRVHGGFSRAGANTRARELLAEVGLEDAGGFARRHPHELSGGQRQRVLFAAALAAGPALLIADEPTSALDAHVQKELLALLRRLQARRELALLFVTHDLAVVAEVAERMAVMYAGRCVEEGPVAELFARPAHPYTRGLLEARIGPTSPRGHFAAIPGLVPVPGAWPAGCAFAPRCAQASARCTAERPAWHSVERRGQACHHPLGEVRP